MYLDISKTSDTGQRNVLISKLQKNRVEGGSLEGGVQLIKQLHSHTCNWLLPFKFRERWSEVL